MADNKQEYTVFQRLNKTFGKEGVKVIHKDSKTYSLNSKEILRTTNKAEYETAKLETQQNKFLGDVWSRVDGEMYQQSIQYETTRMGAYSDYESMEYYPAISAALDIFMEEATTPNEKGKVLNVYSDSSRVRDILNDLFYNRLDIHTSLPMWTRTMCKYGDTFLLLSLDNKKGVTGARQLPTFEIERREGDFVDSLISKNSVYKTDEQTNDDNRIKFFWKGRNVEFNSWQIAHFRLLSDLRRLPYGSAIIEKARRIWKLCILGEDAMLAYRVQRAPERRVFKINVGNISPEDVPAYIDKIANRFKRKPIIDPKTGQIDTRYNSSSAEEDYFIPVRSENAANPIDTLPGAGNLSDIMDIQFLHNQLYTALGIPKSFISFDEKAGGGNMSMEDVRFSRKVNRIQQAMIMELNKIAIIHLYMLGFEDELDNFTITLNNPSTQAEMLKIEHLVSKVQLIKDAVSDSGNGMPVMSWTRALRDILGWTNDEIKQNLLEIRMEKAAAGELELSSRIIRHTGFFDMVDNIYGVSPEERKKIEDEAGGGENGGPDGGSGAGGGGGFAGGGSFGGEDLDLGDEGGEENVEAGQEGTQGGEVPVTGDEGSEVEATPEETTPNTEEAFIRKNTKILTEQKKIIGEALEVKKKKYQNIHLNKLMDSISGDNMNETVKQNYKIQDETLKINDQINEMIKGVDDLLKDNDKKII